MPVGSSGGGLSLAVSNSDAGSGADGVEEWFAGPQPIRRCLRPKDTFKDCPECPDMVVVPAGNFMMGSNDGAVQERPVHNVVIAKPFAIGKFEVTFAEWDACAAAGSCQRRPEDQGWGRGLQPVINVSWDEVVKEFLPWLSRTSGKTYRLLSEAEFEYAARAGSGAKYAWGDDIGRNRANCDGFGSQWDKKQTAPVGSFTANAFGLHDMHGNVMEWVEDCYQSGLGISNDSSARSTPNCSKHDVRGGSWRGPPETIGPASVRYSYDRTGSALGFRVARTLN
jgi:formylglycine-generating enzyme required for sulfatase activity